jgi:hypothetical protein
MRDACQSLLSLYPNFVGPAYEYETGDSYDPDDEYVSVSFDALIGYVLSGESGLDKGEVDQFTYQMLDAICQKLDHMGEWGFEPDLGGAPAEMATERAPILEGKIAEALQKISE